MKLVSVFIAIVLFLLPFNAFAKESTTPEIIANDYILAYPGILPDHSLYFLKKIRDKITVFFISKPENKINYYLLQTDKGIHATSLLLDKEKVDLAKETALKAEHNFTLITYEIKKHRSILDNALYLKLKKAVLKHQEVLKKIIQTVNKDDKKTFETVLYFSAKNVNEIENTLHSSR